MISRKLLYAFGIAAAAAPHLLRVRAHRLASALSWWNMTSLLCFLNQRRKRRP